MDMDLTEKVARMLGMKDLEIARLQSVLDSLQERVDELEERQPRVAKQTEHMMHPSRPTLREVPREERMDLLAEPLYDQSDPMQP